MHSRMRHYQGIREQISLSAMQRESICPPLYVCTVGHPCSCGSRRSHCSCCCSRYADWCCILNHLRNSSRASLWHGCAFRGGLVCNACSWRGSGCSPHGSGVQYDQAPDLTALGTWWSYISFKFHTLPTGLSRGNDRSRNVCVQLVTFGRQYLAVCSNERPALFTNNSNAS